MKAIKKSEPFFHNVYIGTAAERAALVTKYIHDQFYESDTGYMYQWGGTAWGQVSLNGVVNVVSVTTTVADAPTISNLPAEVPIVEEVKEAVKEAIKEAPKKHPSEEEIK